MKRSLPVLAVLSVLGVTLTIAWRLRCRETPVAQAPASILPTPTDGPETQRESWIPKSESGKAVPAIETVSRDSVPPHELSSLRGRALRPDGSPASNTVVNVDSIPPVSGPVVAMRANRHGRFEFTGLRSGRKAVSIECEEGSKTLFALQFADLQDGRDTDLGDVTLGLQGCVSGRVSDPSGNAIGGASVFFIVSVEGEEECRAVSCTTDSQGHYEIRGLGTGTGRVCVSPPHFKPTKWKGIADQKCALDGVASVLDFQFTIAPPTGGVRVRLTSPSGNSEDSSVKLIVRRDRVLPGYAMHKSAGAFVFDRMTPGQGYWIEGHSGTRWGRTDAFEVRANEMKDLTLQLDRAARSVDGRVVDSVTGQAMPNIEVWRQDVEEDVDHSLLMESVLSRDDGTFTLEGVPEDGPFWICARTRGYLSVKQAITSETTKVEIRLVPKKTEKE